MRITKSKRPRINPELELAGDWVKVHGDPADWCQATRDAYRKAIAALHARLGGVS